MEAGRPIALIEDNEDDIFFMQRALKEAGIGNPVILLRNGRNALDYLEGAGPYADRILHPLPFLVLLDLKLPIVSGFEVLKSVRSHSVLGALVVIVLTTSGEYRDVRAAYLAGANAYLVKPPGSVRLLDQMKALRLFWLEQALFPEVE